MFRPTETTSSNEERDPGFVNANFYKSFEGLGKKEGKVKKIARFMANTFMGFERRNEQDEYRRTGKLKKLFRFLFPPLLDDTKSEDPDEQLKYTDVVAITPQQTSKNTDTESIQLVEKDQKVVIETFNKNNDSKEEKTDYESENKLDIVVKNIYRELPQSNLEVLKAGDTKQKNQVISETLTEHKDVVKVALDLLEHEVKTNKSTLDAFSDDNQDSIYFKATDVSELEKTGSKNIEKQKLQQKSKEISESMKLRVDTEKGQVLKEIKQLIGETKDIAEELTIWLNAGLKFEEASKQDKATYLTEILIEKNGQLAHLVESFKFIEGAQEYIGYNDRNKISQSGQSLNKLEVGIDDDSKSIEQLVDKKENSNFSNKISIRQGGGFTLKLRWIFIVLITVLIILLVKALIFR